MVDFDLVVVVVVVTVVLVPSSWFVNKLDHRFDLVILILCPFSNASLALLGYFSVFLFFTLQILNVESGEREIPFVKYGVVGGFVTPPLQDAR